MLLTVFVLTRPDSALGDVVVVGSSHIIGADTIIVSNETICLASRDAPEPAVSQNPREVWTLLGSMRPS